MKKTTKKDFEEFKFRCARWQKFFGLINYSISYQHTELEKDDAQCRYNISGKWAIMTLSTAVQNHNHSINFFIRELALHEVCELLIGELGALARARYNYDEVESAEHEIVMRLVNVLLPLEDVIFGNPENIK